MCELFHTNDVFTQPFCGLAVKALRGMPPTLFNRPVLFTNRSITRCLEHAGDRQIFDFTVSGAPGSTYQGRRHAAEALYGEAAKRPSNYYTNTHTHTETSHTPNMLFFDG